MVGRELGSICPCHCSSRLDCQCPPSLLCQCTGRAASNVFNGDRKLDGSLLKGIPAPSRLGLLTLFEWYKYVEVSRPLLLGS